MKTDYELAKYLLDNKGHCNGKDVESIRSSCINCIFYNGENRTVNQCSYISPTGNDIFDEEHKINEAKKYLKIHLINKI
ncbi:MAG: hypothetical protein ABSG25_11660 [Bryobacteraceae bacterium]